MPATAAPAKIAKTSVYDQLEALIKTYAPPFNMCPKPKVGTKRWYGLCSEKDVEIAGRRFPSVHFASVIEQKDFVGFYYMPVYMSPQLKKEISPRLLKLLKGKSCFHVKEVDGELLSEIKSALDVAVKQYKKNGWV